MRGRAVATGIAAALVALAPGTALAATADGATVSGDVYLDLDGDGTRDDGEPGRAGVQLTLRTDATIVDATVTGSDGTWTFNNVPLSTVTLVVEPPNDLVITGATVPGLSTTSGEAPVDVTGDIALGAVGLGSPLPSGEDVAATVALDESASTDDEFSWRLQALNLGPGDATGPVDLRAVLSGGHDVVAAVGDGWACEPSTTIVLCSRTGDVPAGTALPVVTLTTAPTADVGSTVTVTGTVRLDGVFDGAPLNDEDVATATIGAELAAEDIDGDGAGDLTTAGAATTGMLVAALLALVVGASAVTTTRRSRP